jgi:hypothetical protein
MSTRYSDLAIALRAALQAELADETDLVIERRLKPRLDRAEFEAGKAYLGIYVGAAGWEIIGRQVDRQEWEILLVLQSAVPTPAANPSGNPFGAVTSTAADPVAWADSIFELVEKIKDLWRAEGDDGSPPGALRSQLLAGCDCGQLVHDPIYIPDHLTELGIITSAISLTYRVLED